MVTVFYGADTYRSREAYGGARERAQREVGSAALVLRGESLTQGAFQASVEGQSLFGQAPPLAAECLTTFTGPAAEAVAQVLPTIPHERVVLVWEEGVPPANSRVWRVLKEVADRLERFDPLSETEVMAWVRERVSAAGRSMEPAAVRALLSACGLDCWSLASELDKLLLGYPSRLLTAADVEEVCAPSRTHADPFAVVRALTSGEREVALRLLVGARREGGEPRLLFALLIRELRFLLEVREALDRGERLTTWSVVRSFRIPSSAAEHLLHAAKKTTTLSVRALFDRCAVASYHLNTGRMGAGELLESMVLHPSGR